MGGDWSVWAGHAPLTALRALARSSGSKPCTTPALGTRMTKPPPMSRCERKLSVRSIPSAAQGRQPRCAAKAPVWRVLQTRISAGVAKLSSKKLPLYTAGARSLMRRGGAAPVWEHPRFVAGGRALALALLALLGLLLVFHPWTDAPPPSSAPPPACRATQRCPHASA